MLHLLLNWFVEKNISHLSLFMVCRWRPTSVSQRQPSWHAWSCSWLSEHRPSSSIRYKVWLPLSCETESQSIALSSALPPWAFPLARGSSVLTSLFPPPGPQLSFRHASFLSQLPLSPEWFIHFWFPTAFVHPPNWPRSDGCNTDALIIWHIYTQKHNVIGFLLLLRKSNFLSVICKGFSTLSHWTSASSPFWHK